MSSVNLQILIGNLGRNAEIRYIDGDRGKATFSLATTKTYKNREGQSISNTQWHNVVAWDPSLVKLAEKHFTTGRQVFVIGESSTRSYQDRAGNTNYIREVKANKAIPVDHIDGEGSDSSSMKSIVLGRLRNTPILTTNEAGESSCTLIFNLAEGTLPVELTGGKAEVAVKYLTENNLAYLSFDIVSTAPFKAIATELTLLGQRSNSREEGSNNESDHNGADKSEANPIKKESKSDDIDDLPF